MNISAAFGLRPIIERPRASSLTRFMKLSDPFWAIYYLEITLFELLLQKLHVFGSFAPDLSPEK